MGHGMAEIPAIKMAVKVSLEAPVSFKLYHIAFSALTNVFRVMLLT